MDLVRGATLSLVGALKLNGIAQPMNGWAISAEALPLDGDATVVTLQAEWLDIATGIVRIRAAAAETATWPAQNYQMRIKLTDAAGVVVISKRDTLRMLD